MNRSTYLKTYQGQTYFLYINLDSEQDKDIVQQCHIYVKYIRVNFEEKEMCVLFSKI